MSTTAPVKFLRPGCIIEFLHNTQPIIAWVEEVQSNRVKIFTQMTETHRVRDLAELVAKLTGAEVKYLPNPRKEADENELIVKNEQFLALGLDPTTLAGGLLEEVVDVAKKYAHRIDRSRVPAVSAWTKDIAQRVERDPEGTSLKSVS